MLAKYRRRGNPELQGLSVAGLSRHRDRQNYLFGSRRGFRIHKTAPDDLEPKRSGDSRTDPFCRVRQIVVPWRKLAC